MKKIVALLLLLSLLLVSCGSQNDSAPITPDTPSPSQEETPSESEDVPAPSGDTDDSQDPQPLSRAEALLSEMTLEQKIGQLFLIRPDSLEPGLTPDQVNDSYDYGVTSASDSMTRDLIRYPAGGIIFFGKNLTDPDGLQRYMDTLSSASDIPLLYAVDEEGGIVSRIARTDSFGIRNAGPMGDIGATGDSGRAYDAGAYIGGYLRDLGFSLDFAPVADINSNPLNIVIGNRSFGSDKELVSSMVSSFLDGLHSEKVAGCIKHFPGHGDVSGDTHDGYVAVLKTWDQLLDTELVPFCENMDTADMIMVAHLTLPNITSDVLPASLSYELITEKLRGELGYQGLIITDALAMGAIEKAYSSSEAAVLAFNAGSDILLMPYDYREAFEGVLSAVQSGEISEERLNESVLRILELKERCGLI